MTSPNSDTTTPSSSASPAGETRKNDTENLDVSAAFKARTSSRPLPKMSCWFCSLPGHLSRSCRKRLKKINKDKKNEEKIKNENENKKYLSHLEALATKFKEADFLVIPQIFSKISSLSEFLTNRKNNKNLKSQVASLQHRIEELESQAKLNVETIQVFKTENVGLCEKISSLSKENSQLEINVKNAVTQSKNQKSELEAQIVSLHSSNAQCQKEKELKIVELEKQLEEKENKYQDKSEKLRCVREKFADFLRPIVLASNEYPQEDHLFILHSSKALKISTTHGQTQYTFLPRGSQAPVQEICRFGSKCRNNSTDHFEHFSHSPAHELYYKQYKQNNSFIPQSQNSQVPAQKICRFGSKCQNKSITHFEHFIHQEVHEPTKQQKEFQTQKSYQFKPARKYSQNLEKPCPPEQTLLTPQKPRAVAFKRVRNRPKEISPRFHDYSEMNYSDENSEEIESE